MDKLISIIVPVYNTEKYMRKCVKSILEQTYKNLEIILVNDGSTDSSGDICEEYAKKDNRVIVVNKENGGLSDARNSGLDIASGDYVLFIDSDDYIEINCVEVLANLALNSGASIVLSDGIYEKLENELKYENQFLKGKVCNLSPEETFMVFFKHRGLIGSPWVAWGKLFQKNLFDNIRFPKGMLSEDIATTPKLISNAESIVYTPVKLYHYILREGSIVHRASVKLIYDNYLYAKELHEFATKQYPAITFEADVELVWMCMMLLLAKSCTRENVFNSIYYDMKTYMWKFLKSDRSFKYKILLIMEIICPNFVKWVY